MFDEEGLLARIGESPDDDLVRLVYADWLEENDFGDLAAFVRAQCAFARLPLSDKARGPLRTEIAALLPDVEFHWQRVLGDDVRLTRLSRGLPEAVMWKHWPEPTEMDDLLRRMPSIREVHPGYTPLTVTREMVTAAAGWLGRIEGLNLAGTNEPEVILESFSRREGPGRLKYLDLTASFPGRSLYQAHSDIFPGGLRELRLGNLPIRGEEMYRTMRNRSGTLECLHFSVGQGWLPFSRHALSLVSGVGARNLKELHVSVAAGRHYEMSFGEVHDFGSSVTDLHLAHGGDGVHLIEGVLSFRGETRLRSLSMPFAGVLAVVLEGFLHRSSLGSLRQLNLESALQYPYDIQVVLNSPVYAQLNELNLANNSLADEWMKDMLAVSPPEGLTLIDLRYNKIGKRMQAALADHFGPGVCVFDR